jgi:hypothetical protein
MQRLATYLSILLSSLSFGCSSQHAPIKPSAIETASGIPSDSLPANPPATSVASEEFSHTYYCASPSSDPRDEAGQALIGQSLTDLEDSTLLQLVYGSSYPTPEGHRYNWGSQLYHEDDSVYMQVAERLRNDSLQVIYLRGVYAYTTQMHNHFIESALLLAPDKFGWRVVDAYVDATVIDFAEVILLGTYLGRMLVRYSTSGIYAGGVSFGSDEYKLLETRHLRGPTACFISHRSNAMSEQCFGEADDPEYHCDCYEGSGHVEHETDQKWNAMRFSYTLETLNGDCELADPKTTFARQTWLMNRDTAFQIAGDSLSEWGERIEGRINLSERQIAARLRHPR